MVHEESATSTRVDAQLARRLAQASADMGEAQRYLRALHSAVLRDGWPAGGLCDPVMLAIIVVYARPFTASRTGGRAAPRLDADALQLFAGRPALERLHKHLLSLRNEYIAHADWAHHKTHPLGSGGWVTMTKTPQFVRQDLRVVYRLLRHVQRKVLVLCMPETGRPAARKPPPATSGGIPRFPFEVLP